MGLNVVAAPQDFTHEQHHGKVLLSSFHLNGHTIGSHPQTQKLEPPCTTKLTVSLESTAQLLSFEQSHHRAP